MSGLISDQFANDPTIKWKILNQVRKTRLIDTSSLSIKNNILYRYDTPLTTPWALIAHFLPEVHHNQNFSTVLSDAMSHIDFFKAVKRNHQLQILQGFQTILGALYSLYNNPTDVITWTLAVGSIVTTILMILSMCATTKVFRKMRKAVSNLELHPENLQEMVEGLVKDFATDPPLPDEPEPTCKHGPYIRVSLQRQQKMLSEAQYVVHREQKSLLNEVSIVDAVEGIGVFRGCIHIPLEPDQEAFFFPTPEIFGALTPSYQAAYIGSFSDHNQSYSGTATSVIGPRFTAILSLVYVLGVAGLTKAGFTNVRELLDFARLKNEMKTTVKDAREFIQFIAGDLCDIDLMGDRRLLDELNQQIIENNALLDFKPVDYVKHQKKYYILTKAIADTTSKLKHLTANPELRAAQNALTNLLTSTCIRLNDLKGQVIQLKKTLDTRPDVHVTFLWGKPGLGKTSVGRYIHNEVSKRLNIDAAVYGLNFPENKHWPAYAGQANATYDEFGALKEKDPFIAYLNPVCSTGYFSMDGADLHLKPQPCEFRHLLLMGNAARWPMMNTLKAESVEALWSRMTTYKVAFPNFVSRYDTSTRKADFSHLEFYEEVYSNKDNENRPITSVKVSLETIIDRAVQAYKKHETHFLESEIIKTTEANHKLEAENTCHLVLNVSGKTGVGKTTTYIQDICPTLSTYLRIPTVHITSVDQMSQHTGEKSIFVLDDILTTSASPDTIRKYCEFYARVVPGSLIILISNMNITFRPAVQWTKCIVPVPLPHWKKVLPENYKNNDACIRRLGLTDWVDSRVGPYYTGFTDTEIEFTKTRKSLVGESSKRQPLGTSDTIEFIYNRYCQHLASLREFSVMHVAQIFEPDDSYVKITGFTIERLRQVLNTGGLSLMVHLGKNIKIPQEIFENFNYTYPVSGFQFEEGDDLEKLGPHLAQLFRRNCPTGELYIDCGDVQAITEGNLIKTTLACANRMNCTIKEIMHHHEHTIVLSSRDADHGRDLYIPLHEVFSWYHGDVMALSHYHILPFEITVLQRWCQKNPCAFRKLLRDKTWKECEVGMTALHNKLVPSAISFLSGLPVIELIACLVGIAFGTWAISRIVQSYVRESKHKNQARDMAAGNCVSPTGGVEPDANDYLRPEHRGKNIQLSKETASMYDLTAYDQAHGMWERSSHNQLMKTPLVHRCGPEDIVVQALVLATVKCTSLDFGLHGVMIYDRVGLTNAHLYGNAKAMNPSLTLETFTFQVEHDGKLFTAQIMRYQPDRDFMIFKVLEKTMPAFPDIRKYFFSSSDYRNAETYSAVMVKHRKYTLLEKCNITCDQAASYWSNETQTGVKEGFSIQFITASNSFATEDGDCGSMYITTGSTYGRHQHARILGMHVGMRSHLYPHGTIIPREILEGKKDINQSVSVEKHVAFRLPSNPYNIEAQQVLDEHIVETLACLKPIENPFSGLNVQVLGIDSSQYVEPLKAARENTGFGHLIEEQFGHNSGMRPTATVGIKMDLSHCLKNYTGKPDILLTQFSPYDDLLPTPDVGHLNWCIDKVKDRFAMLYEPLKHPITTSVLFNGFPPGHRRHGTVNPINIHSSAGIYFQKKYGISTKADFFIRDENDMLQLAPTEAAKEYFSRAKMIMRTLHDGKVYQTLTKTCLKSELRPIEKVAIGKVRTFDSADASLGLAHRELLMGAMSSIQMPEARAIGPVQIGINALLDFRTIHERFAKHGGKLLQFDFTEYDRHLTKEIIEGAYLVALHVQDPRPESDEKNRRLAKMLAIQTTCTLRMVGNHVVRTFQGISSGFYFTSLGDSIANYIMLMYVVMKNRDKDAAWFFQNIDAVILGDDISIAVSPEACTTIDLNQMIGSYGELGAKVTAADKVSAIAFQNLDEFAFCSRTIRRTRSGIIVPPLKKKSILGLIEWVTPSKHYTYVEHGITYTHSTEEQIATNLNLCLNEASLHPKVFYDKIRKIADSIQRIFVAKKVQMRISNKIECSHYHVFKEKSLENIILGRSDLKVLIPDHNQLKRITMSIILVEEWCASSKQPKPLIKKHTVPIGTELSQCEVETCWDEPRVFTGFGPNKKASKNDAFTKIVEFYNIGKIESSTLKAFCNLKIKENDILKTVSHDGQNYVVKYQAGEKWLGLRTDTPYCIGRSPILSVANHDAMKQLKSKFDAGLGSLAYENAPYICPESSESDEPQDNFNVVMRHSREYMEMMAGKEDYSEPSKQQMERTTAPQSVLPTTHDAGLSLTSQPARAPPPPSDITPHVSNPTMDQPAIVTMQGGPVAVSQTPNILGPAPMLVFGGVDFDAKDAAHDQVIDHNPGVAISQASIRGQVIAVDDYNPYNKNSKIKEWGDLHERFEGDIDLRYHLIANPIFMGEIAIAWLPDVRNVRPGDIIEDAVYQLYSWKTLSLVTGATEFMSLHDARSDKFYRTNDIEGENRIMPRPGIVVLIYQPMVNPFDNQQAACYLNIGSTLGPNFRFSNPVRSPVRLPPTGPQTPGNNSLSGNTFGTVFSEVGIIDAPQVFMSTDGVNYPTQAAKTTTLSTRTGAVFPPLRFPEVDLYESYSSPSGNGPALQVAAATYNSAATMTGNWVPQFIRRSFSTLQSLFMFGSYPTASLPSQQLLQNLTGLTFTDVQAAFSNPTTTGADAVYTDNIVSGAYSINSSGTWTSWVPTSCLIVTWQEHTLTILFSNNASGTTTPLYMRQVAPMVYGSRTRVAYNYPLLNLPSGQQMLRFSLQSFPAITYSASNQPSVPYNVFEQRLYDYFNTITSTTSGFVQFTLINPQTTQQVATVRYDRTTGFTITTPQTGAPFLQWNGLPVNNLLFENVLFGNRTSTFPQTDVSTWIPRRSAAFSATLQQPTSALLDSFIEKKIIPSQCCSSDRMEEMLKRMEIKEYLLSHEAVVYHEPSHQQALAMAGFAGAGALSGIGQGISNYMGMNKQMDFQKEMQTRKFQFEADNYEKYRNIDMRVKQQLAGALAPINQFNSTKNQISGTVSGPRIQQSSGFRSMIGNPPGARPFVPSAASQRPF